MPPPPPNTDTKSESYTAAKPRNFFLNVKNNSFEWGHKNQVEGAQKSRQAQGAHGGAFFGKFLMLCAEATKILYLFPKFFFSK